MMSGTGAGRRRARIAARCHHRRATAVSNGTVHRRAIGAEPGREQHAGLLAGSGVDLGADDFVCKPFAGALRAADRGR